MNIYDRAFIVAASGRWWKLLVLAMQLAKVVKSWNPLEMQLLCLHQLNWNFSELNPTLYHICILRLCPMVLHCVFIPTSAAVDRGAVAATGQKTLFYILFTSWCWWWIPLYTAAPVQRGAPAGAGHKTDSVLNLLQGYLTIQRFRDKKLSRHHFWKALHFK